MHVNRVEPLPLARLRANPSNPKRPMGARYLRGLRASLTSFGFAGVLVVAGPDADGTYEVLDGNTRLEELDAAGAAEVPCIILDLDADARRAFVLSHDRNRKLFDEDRVVEQFRDLAGRMASRPEDVKRLGDLTATDNLRQLIEDRARQQTAAPATAPAAPPAMGSLVLYGPAEDIDALRQLTKRMRTPASAAGRVRVALEQAERHQDPTDEQWLLALASALERILRQRS